MNSYHFTEQLFLDLILPYVTIKDLLVMRFISMKAKVAADKSIFAFIKSEVIRIRSAITKWPFYSDGSIRIQGFAHDDSWYPSEISAHTVLMHFHVHHQYGAFGCRYNVLTAHIETGVPETKFDNWPYSGYIKFIFNVSHDKIIDRFTKAPISIEKFILYHPFY